MNDELTALLRDYDKMLSTTGIEAGESDGHPDGPEGEVGHLRTLIQAMLEDDDARTLDMLGFIRGALWAKGWVDLDGEPL